MRTNIIRSVTVDPDSGGVVFEFLTPRSDVRSNGLVLNHALLVPAEDDFVELLTELDNAMHVALDEALSRFHQADPLDVPRLVGDDDGDRPYDNPLER